MFLNLIVLKLIYTYHILEKTETMQGFYILIIYFLRQTDGRTDRTLNVSDWWNLVAFIVLFFIQIYNKTTITEQKDMKWTRKR